MYSEYVPDPDVKRRFDEACAKIREQVKARAQVCEVIAVKARHFGMDVDAAFVNRHMEWFSRWDSGYIAKGYLINRLGIKKLQRNATPKGG